MELLFLTLSPFVVSLLTQGVKWLAPVLSRMNRGVLRFVVALLSFGSVVGSAALAGGEVDVASIETFAIALLEFLAATGTFFLFKRRTEPAKSPIGSVPASPAAE